MLAAYRKAFAKVAQDLELVREDQLAPYLGAREDQPLDQRLVGDGLLRALDVERIYLDGPIASQGVAPVAAGAPGQTVALAAGCVTEIAGPS